MEALVWRVISGGGPENQVLAWAVIHMSHQLHPTTCHAPVNFYLKFIVFLPGKYVLALPTSGILTLVLSHQILMSTSIKILVTLLRCCLLLSLSATPYSRCCLLYPLPVTIFLLGSYHTHVPNPVSPYTSHYSLSCVSSVQKHFHVCLLPCCFLET